MIIRCKQLISWVISIGITDTGRQYNAKGSTFIWHNFHINRRVSWEWCAIAFALAHDFSLQNERPRALLVLITDVGSTLTVHHDITKLRIRVDIEFTNRQIAQSNEIKYVAVRSIPAFESRHQFMLLWCRSWGNCRIHGYTRHVRWGIQIPQLTPATGAACIAYIYIIVITPVPVQITAGLLLIVPPIVKFLFKKCAPKLILRILPIHGIIHA
mmetsp:Transcript_27685/g.40861  ORF Transcript_27685/g.40861 Transcript_27685/m.40861 type:complete len:213 (-) Transcript_27685:1291-1929(-)